MALDEAGERERQRLPGGHPFRIKWGERGEEDGWSEKGRDGGVATGDGEREEENELERGRRGGMESSGAAWCSRLAVSLAGKNGGEGE